MAGSNWKNVLWLVKLYRTQIPVSSCIHSARIENHHCHVSLFNTPPHWCKGYLSQNASCSRQMCLKISPKNTHEWLNVRLICFLVVSVLWQPVLLPLVFCHGWARNLSPSSAAFVESNSYVIGVSTDLFTKNRKPAMFSHCKHLERVSFSHCSSC